MTLSDALLYALHIVNTYSLNKNKFDLEKERFSYSVSRASSCMVEKEVMVNALVFEFLCLPSLH